MATISAESLERALTAWRKNPSPRYAEVIEALSQRLAPLRPALGKKPSQLAAWLARAKEKDPSDLPLLLLELGTGTSAAIKQKLEALASWPADPRLDRGLLAAVQEPLLPGRAGRGVMLAVLALLERSTDPLVARTLTGWQTEKNGYVVVRLRMLSTVVLRAYEATLTRLTARVPAPPKPLSAKEDAWCAELSRELASPRASAIDGAALLRRVHEHPADDEARLVYADWLSEQGDERGEFITLQVTRARTGGPVSKRERQLERDRGRSWLGEPEEIILKRDLVYRRGFLAECAIENKYVKQQRLAGHPLFSTVEVFDLTSGRGGIIELALHPTCKALVGVLGFWGEVEQLTRPLRLLGLKSFHVDRLAKLMDRQPTLQELRLERVGAHLPPILDFARAHPALEKLVVDRATYTRADGFTS